MYLVNFETSCKFTQFLNSITNINQCNVCVRTTLKLNVTILYTTTQNHLKTANNCNIDFDAMQEHHLLLEVVQCDIGPLYRTGCDMAYTSVIFFFFRYGAATQRRSWPPHF